MTDLEQHLTDVMTARAEQAPGDLGLLSRVQAAGARRTRVRRFGALGLAVATVAGVALGASVLTGGKPAADRFTDPTGFLVDGRNRAASFPLTPGYLHPTLAARATTVNPYDADGRYGSATWQTPKTPGRSTPRDTVTVEPATPVAYPGATSVTVAGKPGSQSPDCSSLTCSLTWTRAPHQVVTVVVEAASGGAKEEAYAVAAGLKDKPIVVRPKLVLGLVPDADCVLQMPRSFSDGTQSTSFVGATPCGFGATVQPADPGPFPPGGEKVELGGRSGTLREEMRNGSRDGVKRQEPVWGASFPLGDGRELLVTVPRDGGWNREELDRFVRAIIVPKKA